MKELEQLLIVGIPDKPQEAEKEQESGQEPLEGLHDRVVIRIDDEVTPPTNVIGLPPRDPEEMLQAIRERRTWR
jgi:hypothetical protein